MKKYLLAITLCLVWIMPVHAGGYKVKQSTSVVISFGPFVDKTDGNTLETGLQTALDNLTTGIKISKNGGVLAVRNGTPATSTYDSNGNYRVTLNATDTDTLGNLTMSYADNNTTALPIIMDIEVVPASIYYAFFGAATPTLTAEALQVLSVDESVSSNDQWNNGHRFKAWSATTGNMVASSCIVDSATGSPDTITTREDISGFTTVGNLISIESDGGCVYPAQEAHCDVSAATSASSFTVASCMDRDGAAVTLATNIFKGGIWRFYTNGGSACNVIDNSILIGAITSGGVITGGSIVPSATPNTSNCGIWHP